jgi:hypothetical protein
LPDELKIKTLEIVDVNLKNNELDSIGSRQRYLKNYSWLVLWCLTPLSTIFAHDVHNKKIIVCEKSYIC